MIGVINRIIDSPQLRSRLVGHVVLFRTVLYLVSVSVVIAVVALVFVKLILPWEALTKVYQTLTPRYTLSFVVWAILSVIAINFALEIERVVGPGNLWQLFIGRYRQPRKEKRVFLFMDLKGSTSATENLGHNLYSELMQECYRDLTQVVIRYDAVIYQYVGDEVVISWPCRDNGENERASVKTFFAYRKILSNKKEVYETRFDIAPEFRGSIDTGPVTTIEVGDVKREIVYHGDVLNTAARLLELCKARGEELMVSQAVGEAVEEDSGIRTNWHGEIMLRGKRESVEAYSLQPMNQGD
ncbi:adenylate/guanylate cyclase domain-containing protein [Candidatus Neomarinimicrobiota bacterium]